MNRLRELRERPLDHGRARRIPTIPELSQAVGCSDQQIRRLEATGFGNPGIQLAHRLAKALKVRCACVVFPPDAVEKGRAL